MKFLSSTTIFTLLFASAAGANPGTDNAQGRTVTQEPSSQEREIRQNQDEQGSFGNEEGYESEYYEGTRRNMQGEDETFEERQERLKEEREDQKDQDSLSDEITE